MFQTTSPKREKPPCPPNASQLPSESKNKKGSHETNKPYPHPPLRSGMLFDVISELVEGESSIGIVETIFQSGWAHNMLPTIKKVLKVNHSADVLNRFEEYRELVKSKAAETNVSKRMERCVVDGNEFLRFHGAVITCSLGFDGFSSICEKKCCGLCRVIGCSFSSEAGSNISFFENSWRAHEKLTSECVVNGVSAKKVIIVCRVIAGRVARCRKHGISIVDGEDGGFDSVVASTGDHSNGSEELMVLNQSAILPCFVVIYSDP